MRTWEDYKNHVKSISEEERPNMEDSPIFHCPH